eukprot:Gb_35418 [translate_table: standard]
MLPKLLSGEGWTYGLDGRLQKATRIEGIQDFKDYGLLPINVATWGPFVLINLHSSEITSLVENNMAVGNEWLGSSSEILSNADIDQSLAHIARREYTINCNWKVLRIQLFFVSDSIFCIKVFCDNYLDGGYHVPYAHGGLAAGLDLSSYSTTISKGISLVFMHTNFRNGGLHFADKADMEMTPQHPICLDHLLAEFSDLKELYVLGLVTPHQAYFCISIAGVFVLWWLLILRENLAFYYV